MACQAVLKSKVNYKWNTKFRLSIDSGEEGSWNSTEAFDKDQDDELRDLVISYEVRIQAYIINWFCSISNIHFKKFFEGS